MTDNSEFICDVVRIKSVAPHPNADRLDVVQVEGFHGDIISSRGNWKVGDIAVHVGPDSMVPLGNPAFAFLKTRLDVKAGESHYRLRMAKIRGMVSHGILVPVPEFDGYGKFSVGDSLAHELDVLKYETPAERRLRQLEHVTPTVPTLSQRIVARVLRWAGLQDKGNVKVRREVPDYSLVSLRKVSGLFSVGEEVEITEKIHGSNIRFGVYRGKPFIGSHHVIKSDHRPWYIRLLTKRKKQNHWYKSDIWTDWCSKNVDFKELPDNTIFYGEIYGPGVQELDYGASEPMVRVFDVWLVDKQRWATFLEKSTLCNQYGLAEVPILVKGSYSVGAEPFSEGLSTMASHIREGCVVKSLDGTKRGKLVSNAYKLGLATRISEKG